MYMYLCQVIGDLKVLFCFTRGYPVSTPTYRAVPTDGHYKPGFIMVIELSELSHGFVFSSF